jgi:hypothetical protein
MSSKARRARILSATSTPLVLAVLLSGCSESPSAPIAHADGSAAQATPSTGSGSGGTDAQAKFQAYLASERAYAKCMRGIGLDVDDPDSNGDQASHFKDKVRNGGTLSAAQNDGLRQCQAKLLADPRPQTYPTLSDQEFNYNKSFAACFRSHGFPGYPDPIRETDPSLPAVKHYDAALKAVQDGTKTYANTLDTCSVIVTGHTGVG